ncbi:MAG: hypothetical protein RMJ07_04275 [Nitrososphaerota archaeon]|nr:hypothetical protein [Candidatus Bathyarchaeota archaeon]MDW8048879.1 hypothetical protein [Nitrososphaerota archaeon]
MRWQETRAGFRAPLYWLTVRAALAVALGSLDLERLVEEAEIQTVISALASMFMCWV